MLPGRGVGWWIVPPDLSPFSNNGDLSITVPLSGLSCDFLQYFPSPIESRLIYYLLTLQETYGNISERLLLRDRLKCHSFDWYLKNIYPDLHVPEDRQGWHGAVSGRPPYPSYP